jgi:hypothetical protein
MKKVFFTVATVLCVTMIMTGTNFGRPAKSKPVPHRKTCVGYTIISVDRGIDCNGDTLVLAKNHGYYEVISGQGRAIANR